MMSSSSTSTFSSSSSSFFCFFNSQENLPRFIFSGSSRVWNRSRNEATLNKKKTYKKKSQKLSGFFFFCSLWIKCENPLAPKRMRLPVEACFPLLNGKTFQYSVLNAAWSVKWFHEAGAEKVRLIRDDFTPGMKSRPNCSFFSFFSPPPLPSRCLDAGKCWGICISED